MPLTRNQSTDALDSYSLVASAILDENTPSNNSVLFISTRANKSNTYLIEIICDIASGNFLIEGFSDEELISFVETIYPTNILTRSTDQVIAGNYIFQSIANYIKISTQNFSTSASGTIKVYKTSESVYSNFLNLYIESQKLQFFDNRLSSIIESLSSFKKFDAEPQLIEPGTTQALAISKYHNIHCQYTIANNTGSVVVRLEGSNEDSGDNWSNLNEFNCNANGTYSFAITNIPLYRIRFNFVSESDGTDTTIDVRFTAN